MVTLTYKTTSLPGQEGEETIDQSEQHATLEDAKGKISLLEAYDIGDLVIHDYKVDGEIIDIYENL